jgi:hypothetical protein
MPKCTHRWQRVPHLGKNKYKCDWCELFGFCSSITDQVIPHSKEVSEDLLEQYNQLTMQREGKIPTPRRDTHAPALSCLFPRVRSHEEQHDD